MKKIATILSLFLLAGFGATASFSSELDAVQTAKDTAQAASDAVSSIDQVVQGADTSDLTSAAKKAVADKININSATAADFAKVPGISEELGAKIVSYREKLGTFSSIKDLAGVDGIDAGLLSSASSFLTL